MLGELRLGFVLLGGVRWRKVVFGKVKLCKARFGFLCFVVGHSQQNILVER